MSLEPPSDDLAALAADGNARARARDAQRAASEVAQRRLAAARGAALDRGARRRVDRALAKAAFPVDALLAVGSILCVTPMILSASFAHSLPTPLVVTCLVSLVSITLLYFFVLIPFFAERERRLLAGLPFEIDLAGYEARLVDEREKTQIRLLVRFEAPVAVEAQTLVRDVLAAGTDGDRGAFDGGELIVSATLKTRFTRTSSNTGTHTHYENAPVHRWLRRVVRRALLPLHARFPISELVVAVTSTH